jgi:hypothetical protein
MSLIEALGRCGLIIGAKHIAPGKVFYIARCDNNTPELYFSGEMAPAEHAGWRDTAQVIPVRMHGEQRTVLRTRDGLGVGRQAGTPVLCLSSLVLPEGALRVIDLRGSKAREEHKVGAIN